MRLMCSEVRHSTDGSIAALDTKLGWALGGIRNTTTQTATSYVCREQDEQKPQLDQLMTVLWAVEEPPSDIGTLSVEDKNALDHFLETHTRNEEGRFEVQLP